MASMTAVLAVGVRPCGHGSRMMPMSSTMSLSARSSESVWDVMPMTVFSPYVTSQLEDFENLACLAACGERNDGIARTDQTQVAVRGLSRMHEGGGRAGRTERRRTLASDVASLTHSGCEHLAGGLVQRTDGSLELRVHPNGGDCSRLGGEDFRDLLWMSIITSLSA